MSSPSIHGRKIAMLMFDGAEVLDVVGPVEVFNVANEVVARVRPKAHPPYRTMLLSTTGGVTRVSSGLGLCADQALASFRGPLDTLMLAGGHGVHAAAQDAALMRWLKRWSGKARRVASVCSGSFLLAEAGLLDGLHATTHWAQADELQRRYPAVRVDADPLYIRQGHIYTSAGVTAGIDLALALVEEDLGREVALAVARGLVVFFRRPGGQKQFSQHLSGQARSGPAFADLLDWLPEHLGQQLSVATLAERCSMSPRHFARQFLQALGMTPARYIEQVRLERARALLEQRQLSLKAVAACCGFGSGERLRRAFQRQLGVNPADYLSHF